MQAGGEMQREAAIDLMQRVQACLRPIREMAANGHRFPCQALLFVRDHSDELIEMLDEVIAKIEARMEAGEGHQG